MQIMCRCQKRLLVLLYRPKLLQKRLEEPAIRKFLHRYGYTDDMDMAACLVRLQKRIADEQSAVRECFTGEEQAELLEILRERSDLFDVQRAAAYLKMTRREILTTSGHVSIQQALQKAHAEYDKYKKQQDLRLSPVEQSFLDSVEQLERLEDQAH